MTYGGVCFDIKNVLPLCAQCHLYIITMTPLLKNTSEMLPLPNQDIIALPV